MAMNLGTMVAGANEYFDQQENSSTGSAVSGGLTSVDAGKINGVLGMAVGVFFTIFIVALVLYVYSIVLAVRSGEWYMILFAVVLPWIIPIPFLVSIVMIAILLNTKKHAGLGMNAHSDAMMKAAFGY